MSKLTATERDVLHQIADGNDTTNALVESTDHSKGHVQKVLKSLVEKGAASRHRDGPGYRYKAAEDDTSATTTADTGGDADGIMPANRAYDWAASDYHPNPADYYATDGELRRSMAQIKHRHETNTPVRMLVSGDTGTGKTTFAQTLAAWLESREQTAYFQIQFSKDMNDGDLVGVPNLGGDSTVWVDGTLSKAFLAASEDGPGDSRTVVLHLDELNRAPPHVHNALFEALDHRGAVRLDGPRGGELIQANPLDIIVVATINEGAEYRGTDRMDLATKGRFLSKFEVDYLARYEDPSTDSSLVGVDDEAQILVEDHGIHVDLAREMVRAAAEVRRDAADEANTQVDYGVPTRAVKAWAGYARGYHLDGIDNPVMAAAEDAIIENWYDDGPLSDDQQKQGVRNTIESFLDGAPVDEDEFASWNADEQVVCGNCGWSAAKPEAESLGVVATMTCPECNDDRQVRTRTK